MAQEVLATHFKQVQDSNKFKILHLVWEHKEMSKSQLARITGLSPATVSSLTNLLIEEGLVRESRKGISPLGRRPMLVEFDTDSNVLLGIEMDSNYFAVIATTFGMDILVKKRFENRIGKNPYEVLDYVVTLLNETINEINKDGIRIHGVGIATDGIVDHNNGVSIYAPNFNWRNVPIKRYIQDRLNMPVMVDNVCRAAVLGERWFGSGKQTDNLISMDVGVGAGTGVLVNGKLLRGSHGAAGEIGHTTIDPNNGLLCNCGNRGCLETFVSGRAILSNIKSRLENNSNSQLYEKRDRLTLMDINRACHMEDSLAVECIREVARYLGIGVANLVDIFDCDKIILYGQVIMEIDDIIPFMKETEKDRVFDKIDAERTIIEKTTLGYDVPVLGAVALVMEHVFKAD